MLAAAIDSARALSPPAEQVIVAVDHDPALAERLRHGACCSYNAYWAKLNPLLSDASDSRSRRS